MDVGHLANIDFFLYARCLLICLFVHPFIHPNRRKIVVFFLEFSYEYGKRRVKRLKHVFQILIINQLPFLFLWFVHTVHPEGSIAFSLVSVVGIQILHIFIQ